jgi:photosystem II stability/assembly factor-like uncharacterized protein
LNHSKKEYNNDSDLPDEPDFHFEASPSERYDSLLEDVAFGNEQMLEDPHSAVLGTAYLTALEHKQQMISALESQGAAAVAGLGNWIQLGPTAIPNGQTYSSARVLVSGRITSLGIHPTNPQIIYAGAARGGIWKSTDGGITWHPKSDNEASLAIGALALAPSNPDVIYAGTGEGNLQLYTQVYPNNSSPDSFYGEGVLKSIDGGDTWVPIQGSSVFKGAAFYRIAAHPSNDQTVFAATSNGLFRTTDGGSTWIPMINNLPPISSSIIAACDVAIDPSKPNTVYVAFWGNGIYRSNDADSFNPTWTKLTVGFPDNDISRIALAISPSSPEKLYTFVSDGSDGVNGVYFTASRGDSWNPISLSGASVQVAGAYDLDIAVEPSTPDVIFLSGVSLYKGIRNPTANSWSFSDIGTLIHPDNHALAFDPTNHLTVYAGNDGGIYKSLDGGKTWQDNINKGLCILQYEFIDQHPTSSSIVIGGTQDNGTQLFENSPIFYHADDGDGGCAAIDQSNPKNMLHTYYSGSLARSVDGGRSWTNVRSGLVGRALFYPPFSLDKTNQSNIAFGTDRICLDSSQGSGRWPTKVSLPGIVGSVSAITYVNSKLIYAGTSSGQVYKVTNGGQTWSPDSIHAPPLPPRWIWDIATLPGDDNTLILAMSGIGTPHVWEGKVSSSSVIWKDISGSATKRLPDIPAYAISIDSPSVYYVGTEIGIFKTSDSGSNWEPFDQGLPNCAVYDLRLQVPTRLLRAGTHGRGLWECKLD